MFRSALDNSGSSFNHSWRWTIFFFSEYNAGLRLNIILQAIRRATNTTKEGSRAFMIRKQKRRLVIFLWCMPFILPDRGATYTSGILLSPPRYRS
ncbi:hypothetical protein P8452_70789 [Trifolium repens]|nr:hypothetical protein P8452_70789 [Trifolium repens]